MGHYKEDCVIFFPERCSVFACRNKSKWKQYKSSVLVQCLLKLNNRRNKEGKLFQLLHGTPLLKPLDVVTSNRTRVLREKRERKHKPIA